MNKCINSYTIEDAMNMLFSKLDESLRTRSLHPPENK